MIFTSESVIQILGFVGGIGIQTWSIIKFLLKRMDDNKKDIDKDIKLIHDRLEAVQLRYVPREEHLRDITMLNNRLDKHEARLDRIINKLDNLNLAIQMYGCPIAQNKNYPLTKHSKCDTLSIVNREEQHDLA